MQNRLTFREMMAAARRLQEKGEKFTLLGIGPMSRLLIRAVMELAKEKDFPIMLIASRNQVDSDEFGHGYVCNWDQDRFVADVKAVAEQTGFDGLVYLCRDHGGPWQRDEERTGKLPVEEAMAIAIRSFKHDMDSGFDLLHIDPTKDPHIDGTVPLDLVLSRTVQIIEELEEYRREKGLPEVSYEVGTEETNGGLTSVEAFGDFVEKLTSELKKKGLCTPEFVVGQTGTLTRLTENIGHFSRENAQKLAASAAKHNVGIKEHNGDYLPDYILLEHPCLGITAMNVAPEFGVVETRSYLELAKAETRCVDSTKCSRLAEVISEHAVKSQRWRKWMMGDTAIKPAEEVLKDTSLVAQITDICGHYTYEIPEVQEQLEIMRRNLQSVGIDADGYVIYKIKEAINRYTFAFGLHGLTTRLLNA